MSSNPNATDYRYGLDIACYLLHRRQARSLRILTRNPEMAKAVLRRTAGSMEDLIVESAEIAAVARECFGLEVALPHPTLVPDAALVPFARRRYATPPIARSLVVIEHNALSYKSLLYPGQVQDNIMKMLKWFTGSYEIQNRVGLFCPRFLFHYAIAVAAGSRWPSLHFRSGQLALDHIYSKGRFWWLGYVIVLAGSYRPGR